MGLGELLVEAIDAAVLSDEALLASVEGVAIAAGIDLDFLEGGTSFEGGSAGGAGDDALLVLGMDSVFHFSYLLSPYGLLPHRERDNYTQNPNGGQCLFIDVSQSD